MTHRDPYRHLRTDERDWFAIVAYVAIIVGLAWASVALHAMVSAGML